MRFAQFLDISLKELGQMIRGHDGPSDDETERAVRPKVPEAEPMHGPDDEPCDGPVDEPVDERADRCLLCGGPPHDLDDCPIQKELVEVWEAEEKAAEAKEKAAEEKAAKTAEVLYILK